MSIPQPFVQTGVGIEYNYCADTISQVGFDSSHSEKRLIMAQWIRITLLYGITLMHVGAMSLQLIQETSSMHFTRIVIWVSEIVADQKFDSEKSFRVISQKIWPLAPLNSTSFSCFPWHAKLRISMINGCWLIQYIWSTIIVINVLLLQNIIQSSD